MLKYHIQTVELTSAQKTVSFNSIPQDFTDLVFYYSLRDTGTNGGFRVHETALSFNNSTANFSARALGTEVPSVFGFTVTSFGGWHPDAASTANTFGNTVLYIPNYTQARNKSYFIEQVAENNETKTFFSQVAGVWSNTSPITSVTFTCQGTNLAAGSTISLYGVRRGSDGVTSPVAQGGVVTTSGGYTIHTFNASGTFTAFRPLECEYLVIAGGGGTHPDAMTSGGAGGYRCSVVGEMSGGGATAEPKISLLGQTSYPVLVGAGGSRSSKGSDSTFASITSIGGGSGESGYINTRINGGSGSGNILGQPAGTGVAGQGFAGGNGTMAGSSGTNGGGAGGAGQAGFAPVNNTSSGNGGSGVSSSITGSAVTRAGGGGGGYYTNTLTPDKSTGLGGAGGGGRGMFRVLADPGNPGSIDGQSGTANTGGGSGGGAPSYGSYVLNGGSGVVIIRYLTPA